MQVLGLAGPRRDDVHVHVEQDVGWKASEVRSSQPRLLFNFAVRGTFGDFNDGVRSTLGPRNPASGVCVNSYLFWNNRTAAAPSTGFTVADAFPIIAANPYGTGWYGQCSGGGAVP